MPDKILTVAARAPVSARTRRLPLPVHAPPRPSPRPDNEPAGPPPAFRTSPLERALNMELIMRAFMAQETTTENS